MCVSMCARGSACARQLLASVYRSHRPSTQQSAVKCPSCALVPMWLTAARSSYVLDAPLGSARARPSSAVAPPAMHCDSRSAHSSCSASEGTAACTRSLVGPRCSTACSVATLKCPTRCSPCSWLRGRSAVGPSEYSCSVGANRTAANVFNAPKPCASYANRLMCNSSDEGSRSILLGRR